MQAVLVVTADSTSIRFAAYDGTSPGELSLIGNGHVALSGSDVEFFVKNATCSHPEIARSRPADGAFDHDKAMARMFRWVDRHCGLKLTAVGHRATHGGQGYPASVLVNDGVVEDLAAVTPHEHAHCLKAIRFLRERLPEVPQVVCFESEIRASPLHVVQPNEASVVTPVAETLPMTEKAIAVDTLRCIERTPTTAEIHAFPSIPAPSRHDNYPSVPLAVAV